MKKLCLALIAFSLALSCNQEPQTLEAAKTQLSQKEKEARELAGEIKALKEKVASMDSSAGSTDTKATPVKVNNVERQTFEHFVRLTGTITSRKNVLLSAEAMGRVVEISVREGESVKAGQTLVRLNAEGLKEQLQEARSSLSLAKTTFERRQRLWKEDSIGSEIEYLNAKTNYEAARNRLGQIRAQYENTFIKSPVDGEVDEIEVNVGEYLSAGMPVVRVVDLSNLEVEAELSENYLQAVDEGDSVWVSVPTLGYESKQRIAFVSQYINPENRSFKIKVALNNSKKLLKPNLLAEVKIRDYVNEDAIVVPTKALKRDLTGEYLYTIQKGAEGQTQVGKKYVEKGRSSANRTEILSGISHQDRVVVEGFNQVADGEAVNILTESDQ